LTGHSFEIEAISGFSHFCVPLYNWFSFIVTNTRVERNLIKPFSGTCQAETFVLLSWANEAGLQFGPGQNGVVDLWKWLEVK